MAAGVSSVVRGGLVELQPVAGAEDDRAGGLEVGVLCDDRTGSVHMEVAVSELAPGGHVAAHVHPFEESFYILEGRALLQLEGGEYRLRRDDFGFAPIGVAHAWSNPGAAPVRWLRVRTPQPRPIGNDGSVTFWQPRSQPPPPARDVDEQDPSVRHLGHFADEQLPPPGPLSMPGYHGLNVQTVSIRMMVDEILGAAHHAMFMVQFAPAENGASGGAKEHFHPFEEMFYFLRGRAIVSLEGNQHEVAPGDLLFLGVNAAHGIRNAGDEPVRWIEVQAPKPPPSDAFFFADDWERLRQ